MMLSEEIIDIPAIRLASIMFSPADEISSPYPDSLFNLSPLTVLPPPVSAKPPKVPLISTRGVPA